MSHNLTGDVLQTSLVQMQRDQFNQKFNQQQKSVKKRQQLYHIWTSLHNYPLEGPYNITSLNNQVWYCDNKYCRHTQHGVYKKYTIPAWRSTKLGKGYVLCDGCVRAYPRQQQNQQQQHQRQYSQQQTQYQQPQYPQQNQYNQNIQKQNTYLQQQQQQQQYQQQQYQQQPYQYNQHYQPQQFVNNTSFTQQDLNLVKSQPEGLNSSKVINNNNMNNKNNLISPTPTIRSTPLSPPMNNSNNNTLQYSNYNNQINTNTNTTSNNNKTFYTVKEGWMMKQGNDFLKGWKRRYFYFYSNGNLLYYENNKTQKEKGRVNFMDATSITKKKQQGFVVATSKRKWQFVCKTQQTRDEWIKHIATICRVPVLD